MDKRVRNVLVAPIVIFVRLPLMAALWLIAGIGSKADDVAEWAARVVPGFIR